MPARAIGTRAEGNSRRRDEPKGRLAVGVKVKNNAGRGRNAQPQKRPPLRSLRLERPPEQVPNWRKLDREVLRIAQTLGGNCCSQ